MACTRRHSGRSAKRSPPISCLPLCALAGSAGSARPLGFASLVQALLRGCCGTSLDMAPHFSMARLLRLQEPSRSCCLYREKSTLRPDLPDGGTPFSEG